VRGFKVHASVVDPLATPLVAQSIDIETAAYDGKISAPTRPASTLTRLFRMVQDDYMYTLKYIANATANERTTAAIASTDTSGGTLPTRSADERYQCHRRFRVRHDGSVNFGGSTGSVPSRGTSFATWNDPAIQWLGGGGDHSKPSILTLGFVVSGLLNNEFTMTVLGGRAPSTYARARPSSLPNRYSYRR